MPVGEPLLTRPRDAGELLDQAAFLVRETFPQALRAVLIGYLPWSLALAVPLLWSADRLESTDALPAAAVRNYVGWLTAFLLVDIVLLRQFVRGWLFAVSGAWLQGLRHSQRSAARAGLRRLPAAAAATLATCGLCGALLPLGVFLASDDPTTVGLVLVIAPVILMFGTPLWLLGFVAVAIVQLERRGPWAASLRSVRLCAAHIGLTLTVAVVLLVVRLAMGLVPALATNPWLQTTLSTLLTSGLVILDVAVETLLLFTLRCRCEDYDLECLSREVELSSAAELTAGPAPVGRSLAQFDTAPPRY